MNKIHLIGNLTRDPELTTVSNGVDVCNFTIAVNRKYKNSDGERATDYFNCKAWRKLGNTVAKYVKKGNKVLVVGSVETGSYENDKGGKRSTFTVVASEVEFLTPRTNSEERAINDALQTDNTEEDASH